MSRPPSILSLVVIVAFFGAAATSAQTNLQGRSQYDGLIRNVNSGRCLWGTPRTTRIARPRCTQPILAGPRLTVSLDAKTK